MAVIQPPLFLQAGKHPARIVRALIAEMFDEGVLSLAHLKVTQRATGGANYSVDVSAGRCIVQGDNIDFQGNYMVTNDDVVNLVPSSVPSGGNTRIDSVVVQVRDDTEDSGTFDDARIYIKAGTPTTGSPSAPSLGNNEIRLADILITSATTVIADADITDRRVLAGRRCTPGTIEWLSIDAVPSGWIAADGVARNRADYPDLAAAYEAMGWPYGAGDGSTTFGVPDLRGKVAIPAKAGQAQVDTIGESGGDYNLQAHTHANDHDHASYTQTFTTAPSRVVTGSFATIPASTTTGFGIESTSSVPSTAINVPPYTGATGPAGSGAGQNMQPYQVVGLAVIRT